MKTVERVSEASRDFTLRKLPWIRTESQRNTCILSKSRWYLNIFASQSYASKLAIRSKLARTSRELRVDDVRLSVVHVTNIVYLSSWCSTSCIPHLTQGTVPYDRSLVQSVYTTMKNGSSGLCHDVSRSILSVSFKPGICKEKESGSALINQSEHDKCFLAVSLSHSVRFYIHVMPRWGEAILCSLNSPTIDAQHLPKIACCN